MASPSSSFWGNPVLGYPCSEYGHYPGETSYGVATGGYGMNRFVSFVYAGSPMTVYYPDNDPDHLHRLTSAPDAAELVLWGDYSGAGSIHHWWTFYPETPAGNTMGWFYRHQRGLNLGFADGHVTHFSEARLAAGEPGDGWESYYQWDNY